MSRLVWLLVLGVLLTACQRHESPTPHGRFERVWLGVPSGPVHSVVIWLMPGRSRTAIDRRLGELLVNKGALVISVSAPGLLARMAEDGDECLLPAGDLDNLARETQAQVGLDRYVPPVLAGRGAGAALAYAALAQAPTGGFAGGLSLDFDATLASAVPFCPGRGLRANFDARQGRSSLQPDAQPVAPWVVSPMSRDPAFVRRFVNHAPDAVAVVAELPPVSDPLPRLRETLQRADRALRSRLPQQPPITRLDAGQLPLIEVPAMGANAPVWALLMSGDGGWAGLDRDLSRLLAAQGVAVVGFDSLRYFWQPRTPEGLAQDLRRILTRYQTRWPDRAVILIGYSQGANVLPFAYQRLPAELQARVARLVLLGPGERAAFAFQVSQWWRKDTGDYDVLPAARRLPGERTLCVYGQDEAEESICPRLAGTLPVMALPGGHHFDGDMAHLARIVLGAPAH